MKNTKETGIIEFTVFKEKNSFVGVCLTFDIIVEGTDYDQVKQEIEDAAVLHLETVRELNLSDELLNRPAPQKYWNKREKITAVKSPKYPASYEASPYTNMKFATC